VPLFALVTPNTPPLPLPLSFRTLRCLAFTAHPHVDPTLKRFVGWGWTNLASSDSTRIRLQEWSEDWSKAAPEVSFVMKGCALAPHDFALTVRVSRLRGA
jgi:carotenoid cleavage dioxygenase-like enzyme